MYNVQCINGVGRTLSVLTFSSWAKDYLSWRFENTMMYICIHVHVHCILKSVEVENPKSLKFNGQ